ncbi:alkaline phosphatase family protein [Frateuria aurantia]
MRLPAAPFKRTAITSALLLGPALGCCALGWAQAQSSLTLPTHLSAVSQPSVAAGSPAHSGSTYVAAESGQQSTLPVRLAPKASSRSHPDADLDTATPVKHVILIIGENRTFDHLYGTYVAPAGQHVDNLLSKGIVTIDGTPGPHAALAHQWQARSDRHFSIAPPRTAPYRELPPINTGSAPTQAWFASAAQAKAIEPALDDVDYAKLAVGGTGLPTHSVDSRFPAHLPNGPVNVHASLSDSDYTSSPVHRFFQMWQQLDCSVAAATRSNPSGCRADLFPWVEMTVGAGGNGDRPPSPFTDQSTLEGSSSMQFVNMAKGDAPYMAQLAREYTLSDNFHQSVMGGTGTNHIMLGFGEPVFYADAQGRPAVPPANQIENPDPLQGTVNWYTQDGYYGGSYVQCADDSQPGVASIKRYLKALYHGRYRGTECRPGAYYLVNNYNPGYFGDGTPAPLGPKQFTATPSHQNNLALMLNRHHVSWKYYGEGWNHGKEDGEHGTFCNICNPFLYSSQVMTDPSLRGNNQGLRDLYRDLQNGTLPAVAIVKPDAILDGHPASSRMELFEAFSRKIIEMAQANPAIWKDTAIMLTFDEGGGLYDSGYVQPIDFFGDGTRIPLLVISRWSTGGRISHVYGDHLSFDKFVEANWKLHQTLLPHSRDTLPNPVTAPGNPYVPINGPAIGDLMDMFDFSHAAVPLKPLTKGTAAAP